MTTSVDTVRRPIATRSARWVQAVARLLVRFGLKPNHVSILSVCFAIGAGGSLLFAYESTSGWRAAWLVIAAACIQLRLLCNLLDGLMAVEGGLKSNSGEIFNDLPDRIADAIVLVCAGYAIRHIEFAVSLGWTTALLAVLTAYVRVLGGSTGLKQDFCGPMAKPHRMATFTVACILATLEPFIEWNGKVIFLALAIIALGCIVTIIRRTARIIRQLESKNV